MDKESIRNSIEQGDLSLLTTYQAGVVQASSHRLLQKYCDEVLQQYGLTKMNWLIIGVVLDSGPSGIRLTDLSDTVGATMSYMTGVIKLLELRGMVSRSSHGTDSRSKIIIIDPEFAKKCPEIEQTLREALRKTIYADVSPADFRIYMKVLFQLDSIKKK